MSTRLLFITAVARTVGLILSALFRRTPCILSACTFTTTIFFCFLTFGDWSTNRTLMYRSSSKTFAAELSSSSTSTAASASAASVPKASVMQHRHEQTIEKRESAAALRRAGGIPSPSQDGQRNRTSDTIKSTSIALCDICDCNQTFAADHQVTCSFNVFRTPPSPSSMTTSPSSTAPSRIRPSQLILKATELNFTQFILSDVSETDTLEWSDFATRNSEWTHFIDVINSNANGVRGGVSVEISLSAGSSSSKLACKCDHSWLFPGGYYDAQIPIVTQRHYIRAFYKEVPLTLRRLYGLPRASKGLEESMKQQCRHTRNDLQHYFTRCLFDEVKLIGTNGVRYSILPNSRQIGCSLSPDAVGEHGAADEVWEFCIQPHFFPFFNTSLHRPFVHTMLSFTESSRWGPGRCLKSAEFDLSNRNQGNSSNLSILDSGWFLCGLFRRHRRRSTAATTGSTTAAGVSQFWNPLPPVFALLDFAIYDEFEDGAVVSNPASQHLGSQNIMKKIMVYGHNLYESPESMDISWFYLDNERTRRMWQLIPNWNGKGSEALFQASAVPPHPTSSDGFLTGWSQMKFWAVFKNVVKACSHGNFLFLIKPKYNESYTIFSVSGGRRTDYPHPCAKINLTFGVSDQFEMSPTLVGLLNQDERAYGTVPSVPRPPTPTTNDSPSTPPDHPSALPQTNVFLGILLGVALFAGFFACLIGVYMKFKMRRLYRSYRFQYGSTGETGTGSGSGSKSVKPGMAQGLSEASMWIENLNYSEWITEVNKRTEVPTVNIDKLVILSELGAGAFGRVYLVELKSSFVQEQAAHQAASALNQNHQQQHQQRRLSGVSLIPGTPSICPGGGISSSTAPLPGKHPFNRESSTNESLESSEKSPLTLQTSIGSAVGGCNTSNNGVQYPAGTVSTTPAQPIIMPSSGMTVYPRRMALKQLRQIDHEKLEDLEREACVLTQLSHPNIVKFFGIAYRSSNPVFPQTHPQSAVAVANNHLSLDISASIGGISAGGAAYKTVTPVLDVFKVDLGLLFEFMHNGDLVRYLRTHNPYESECLDPCLEICDLLHIALNVVSGLEYLAEKHLVHRDLAARNCLVGYDMVVKLSDFGMTRDIYVTDYYKQKQQSTTGGGHQQQSQQQHGVDGNWQQQAFEEKSRSPRRAGIVRGLSAGGPKDNSNHPGHNKQNNNNSLEINVPSDPSV